MVSEWPSYDRDGDGDDGEPQRGHSCPWRLLLASGYMPLTCSRVAGTRGSSSDGYGVKERIRLTGSWQTGR